jgi:hypothetical protein
MMRGGLIVEFTSTNKEDRDDDVRKSGREVDDLARHFDALEVEEGLGGPWTRLISNVTN